MAAEPPSGRAYLRLILLGALIGIPAALVAALFLACIHELENLLWDDLPEQLGSSSPPWYLVIGLPVAGAALVAAARTLLPGDGGHSPLEGIGGGPRRSSTRRASCSPRSARSRSGRCSARRLR